MTKIKQSKFLFNRFIIRLRLILVRIACYMFLPRNVWIGKHYGAYTQKWSIQLGKIDNRGVLQGISEKDI